VWAAGDARSGALKQAATAAGDGVVAALNAKEYLKHRPGAAPASPPGSPPGDGPEGDPPDA